MMFSPAISGPTASGKTELSLLFAEHFHGEIISADSMQIYKGMDVGTAKATPDEQLRAPHHLIDLVSPLESYSAQRWREDALKCAETISKRGNLPIFVGGTGLYFDSLIRPPQNDSPESDPEYRDALLKSVGEDNAAELLWQRLYSVDPESAEKTHKNNIKRVIRALEIYDKTGITKSELDRRSKLVSTDINLAMITLDFHDRELLYKRIDRRVDCMLRDGLVEEVRSLYERGLLPDSTTASQAIGYKELKSYLDGKCSLEAAADEIRLASRRYAKRQLTWFRHNEGACRVFVDDGAGFIRSIKDIFEDGVRFVEEEALRLGAKIERTY